MSKSAHALFHLCEGKMGTIIICFFFFYNVEREDRLSAVLECCVKKSMEKNSLDLFKTFS